VGLEIMSRLRDPETNEYLGQIKAVFDYGTFIDQFVGVEDLDVYEIKVVDKAGTIVATSLDDKSKVNNDDVNVKNSAYFLNAMSGISGKLSKGEIDGLSIDVQGRDEIGSFGESFKGVLAAFNFLKDEAEKKQ
jgi:hypothetical protein